MVGSTGGEYDAGKETGYFERASNIFVDLLTRDIRSKAESRIEYHKQKDPKWMDYLTPKLLSDELLSGTDNLISAIYNGLMGSKIDEVLQELLDAEKSAYKAAHEGKRK